VKPDVVKFSGNRSEKDVWKFLISSWIFSPKTAHPVAGFPQAPEGRIQENAVCLSVCLFVFLSVSVCLCASEPVDGVWRVVRSFPAALSAAQSLIADGVVDKVWVLGGARVYQVHILCLW